MSATVTAKLSLDICWIYQRRQQGSFTMEHTCPAELAKPATKQKCSAALERWCAQYSSADWAEYGYFQHVDGHWGYFPDAVTVKYRWDYWRNDWYNIYDKAMSSLPDFLAGYAMNHEYQKMHVNDNKRYAHDADAAPGTTSAVLMHICGTDVRIMVTVNGASRKVSYRYKL